MYSELCSIGEDVSLNRSRVYLGKPKYILMDVSGSHKLDGRSVFVLYNTNKKSNFFSTRKIIISVTVLIAFVLGFTLGTIIPLHLTAEKIAPFAEHRDLKNILVARNVDFTTDNSTKSEKYFLRNRLLDGIFWSDYVEKLLPRGFGKEEELLWNGFVENNAIVRIEDGCGRMQNRMVIFSDGTKACCRYRPNTDQIQGEIFSYYLGRMLGIENLVPSALVVINSSAPLWQPVAAELGTAQWAEGRPVVLTRFVEDLLPANIPKSLQHILSSASTLRPLRHQEARDTLDLERIKTDLDVTEMAQWSDLIVFDYLTANLDRVVNNLYNLQWNQDMLASPTHNLARTRSSNLLVFLDNESGLLHGYRLLKKYEPYHILLLEGFCVFRRSTVDALADLRSRGLHLPTSTVLPSLPDKNVDILQQRLDQVLHQVLSCVRRHRWKN